MVSVDDRLETLERKVNFYRWLFLGACVLSIVLAGTSAVAVQSKEVRANKFILEDSSGRVRGVWHADENAGSFFALYNPQGQKRVVFDEDSDSCGLSLYDNQNKPLMVLALTPEASIFQFADPTNLPRVVLMTEYGKDSSFSLKDVSGKDRITAIASLSETSFSLNDATQSRFAVFVHPGGAVCGLSDRYGRTVWNTPLAE